MINKHMKIKIYSRPSCTYCDQAKSLLMKCNLPYEEFVVGIHISVEELVEELKRNVKTVPQIVIDKELIGGFNHLKEYLLDKGYINFKGEVVDRTEQNT